jgi:hypothetical protein
MLDLIDQTKAEGVALLAGDYDPRDLGRILIDAGSEVELFLKETVYESRRQRSTFKDLIDDLAHLGVPAEPIRQLDQLRILYNKAKHDPSYKVSSAETLRALEETASGIRSLSQQGIGLCNSSPPRTIRRTFWIAAWDHFTSHDTEVQLILPTPAPGMPPTLDMIYIDWQAWDPIVNKLKTEGLLRLGKDTVPNWFYEHCAVEDFIDAGAFDGDYRELIKLLSAHEKRQDLIPFLLRENDSSSMFAAVLLATVDLVTGGLLCDDPTELAERIARIAAHQYSAPRASRMAAKYVKHVAALLSGVPKDIKSKLSGPLWLPFKQFEELKEQAVACSDVYILMILSDGRLVVSMQ